MIGLIDDSLFLVAAGILIFSGISKLREPSPAARALEQAGLPSGRPTVRILGTAEIAVGGFGLARPGTVSGLLVAIVYAGFIAFLVWIRRQPDSTRLTCGCFGGQETPPSLLHILLNLAAAGAGLLIAIQGGDSVVASLRDEGSLSVPYMVDLILLGWLSMALVVYVPRMMFAYQRVIADPPEIPELSAAEALLAAGVPFDDPSLWPSDSFSDVGLDVSVE